MDIERFEDKCHFQDGLFKSKKKGKPKPQMVRQIKDGTKGLKNSLSRGKSDAFEKEKARKKAVSKINKKSNKKSKKK
jgi:hypothetical protein